VLEAMAHHASPALRLLKEILVCESAGPIDRAVSSIEGLDIPDEEKRRIFEGTALSILNNV